MIVLLGGKSTVLFTRPFQKAVPVQSLLSAFGLFFKPDCQVSIRVPGIDGTSEGINLGFYGGEFNENVDGFKKNLVLMKDPGNGNIRKPLLCETLRGKR